MTAEVSHTIQVALDNAQPGELPSALQKIKLGTMLTRVEETLTAASHVITLSQAALIIESIEVLTAAAGKVPPMAFLGTTATDYVAGNIGAIATIDATRKIITFHANLVVATVKVKYLPAPAVATSTNLAS